MGFWNKLKAELIDIVEWIDSTNDTLVHRFERYDNELKYGAKLIVREGQAAVFINEGKLADVFKPGTYTLETKNLPILSTLMGWKYGFSSPFKAEVYFISMRRFTNQKWGTKNGLPVEDPQYGPMFLRAFGTYTFHVKDPAVFIREVVGTDGQFTTDEITEQIRNLIVPRVGVAIGECKIPFMQMLSNYGALSDAITKKIGTDLNEYGIEVLQLLVENISLPPDQEEAMKKRQAMMTVGNVNANMQAYTAYQTANAIPDAAKNAGGLASAGIGLGLGIGMAQQVAQNAPPPFGQGGGQMAPNFFAAINGQQAGPFDMAGLRQAISSGQISRDTLIWRNGMPQWTAASQVPDLSPLFPPPIPGAGGPPPIPGAGGPPPIPR